MLNRVLEAIGKPPVFDTTGYLHVTPLTSISMITQFPGAYSAASPVPNRNMILGLLENAIGTHFNDDLRSRIYESLVKEKFQDTALNNSRGFNSLLRNHVRLDMVSAPAVRMRIKDVQNRLAKNPKTLSHINGARHIGLKGAGAASTMFHAEKENQKERIAKENDLYGDAPTYYTKVIDREYIVFEDGDFVFRVTTSVELADVISEAVEAPASFLYLGNNDGWVEARFTSDAPLGSIQARSATGTGFETEDSYHFWVMYGLAVAAVEAGVSSLGEISKDGLKEALLSALEASLDYYRMMPSTVEKPKKGQRVSYKIMKFQELKSRNAYIKAGNEKKGMFLRPTVMVTEKAAGTLLEGDKGKFNEILDELREAEDLSRKDLIRQSTMPLTSETNQYGGCLRNPRVSLLERAASLLTTMTPWKAAANEATIKSTPNVCIVPLLPLQEMINFVWVLQEMMVQEIDLNTHLSRTLSENKFQRPMQGNFPGAGCDVPVMGPLALLSAVSEWRQRAECREWASSVLEYFQKEGCVFYMVDNGGSCNIYNIDHHVVGISAEGLLSDCLKSVRQAARFAGDSRFFLGAVSDFLCRFNAITLRTLLGTRTEVLNGGLANVIRRFYMKKTDISKEIVEGALVLGSSINGLLYRMAKDKIRDSGDGEARHGHPSDKKVQDAKRKFLLEFEQSINQAHSPRSIMKNLSIIFNRMGGFVPTEATAFYNALVYETISVEDARQLLIVGLYNPNNRTISDKSEDEENE